MLKLYFWLNDKSFNSTTLQFYTSKFIKHFNILNIFAELNFLNFINLSPGTSLIYLKKLIFRNKQTTRLQNEAKLNHFNEKKSSPSY